MAGGGGTRPQSGGPDRVPLPALIFRYNSLDGPSGTIFIPQAPGVVT